MYVQIQGNYGNTPYCFHTCPSFFLRNVGPSNASAFKKILHTSSRSSRFGKSPLRFNAVTSEVLRRVFGDFIRESGFKKSIWCGISFGGYLAIRLYELIPDLCSGLILADTFAGSDDNETKKKMECD